MRPADGLRKSDSLSSSSTAFSSKLETPTDSLNKQLHLRPTAANIHQIKEIISIRIDMGRAYSKLGKCNKRSPGKRNREPWCNWCEDLTIG